MINHNFKMLATATCNLLGGTYMVHSQLKRHVWIIVGMKAFRTSYHVPTFPRMHRILCRVSWEALMAGLDLVESNGYLRHTAPVWGMCMTSCDIFSSDNGPPIGKNEKESINIVQTQDKSLI